MKEQFYALLIEVVRSGGHAQAGFKRQTWTMVARTINETHHPQPQLDWQQCRQKLTTDKQNWDAWVALRKNSGFGWDHEKGIPTADEGSWETQIKVSFLFCF
jgi:hypothetical protein